MIKLKELLTEGKKKEYGCVMAYIDGEAKDKLNAFNKSLIPDDVIYDNKAHEFGREMNSHVTIKFGLTKAYSHEEMQEMLKDVKPFKVHFKKISLFENPEFDVVKFDIESEDLKKLNKQFSKLPNEDEHPTYHAHSTLAYVKPGEGKKFIKKSKKMASVEIKRIVYSYKGKKESFTLKG